MKKTRDDRHDFNYHDEKPVYVIPSFKKYNNEKSKQREMDAIAPSLEKTVVVRITLTEPPVGKRKQYDKQGEEMTGQSSEIHQAES